MSEPVKYYKSTFTFEGKRYCRKGRTKKEADQKAALYRAELEAGALSVTNMTVAEWWPEYLETYHSKASHKTVGCYQSIYAYTIGPYIGPRALKSVRSADLQRILNNLSTRSESYAKKAKILLCGMFRKAADNGLIPRDPACALVLPNAIPEVPRRALTEEERELFTAAAQTCGKAGQFFLLIYHTGLRPSEAARVCFEDFDRSTRILHVRGSKTAAATRDVPVPAAFEIPEGEGYAFLTRWGHAPRESARQLWWEKLKVRMEEISGRPVPDDLTPYCLRHDCCTRMLDAGVPLDAVSYIMGHASLQMTAKRYRHPTDAMLASALYVIDESLGHTLGPTFEVN